MTPRPCLVLLQCGSLAFDCQDVKWIATWYDWVNLSSQTPRLSKNGTKSHHALFSFWQNMSGRAQNNLGSLAVVVTDQTFYSSVTRLSPSDRSKCSKLLDRTLTVLAKQTRKDTCKRTQWILILLAGYYVWPISNFVQQLLTTPNHGTYSNRGTQVGTQSKDFGAVLQTDLTRV